MNNWIKTEDALPTKPCSCWLVIEGEVCFGEAIELFGEFIFETSNESYGFREITHWQEIEVPELPKEN